MTKDEALKLALEALESCSAGDYSTGHVIHPSFDVDAVNKAIDAVDEALAQPEHEWLRGECVKCGQSIERQEPVAWVSEIAEEAELMLEKPRFQAVPLYTLPHRKPLTDEKFYEIARTSGFDAELMKSNKAKGLPSIAEIFGRALESAHGIKE